VNNLSLRGSLFLQNFSEKLFKVLGTVLFELAFDDLVNIFRLIRALFLDFLLLWDLFSLLIRLLFNFGDAFGEEILSKLSLAASFVDLLGSNLQRVQRSKSGVREFLFSFLNKWLRFCLTNDRLFLIFLFFRFFNAFFDWLIDNASAQLNVIIEKSPCRSVSFSQRLLVLFQTITKPEVEGRLVDVFNKISRRDLLKVGEGIFLRNLVRFFQLRAEFNSGSLGVSGNHELHLAKVVNFDRFLQILLIGQRDDFILVVEIVEAEGLFQGPIEVGFAFKAATSLLNELIKEEHAEFRIELDSLGFAFEANFDHKGC
jgi:hypothetical protein